MTGIAAIPTRYAGCHFRSRLEARWAVFFDTLGIKWEYEPEGLKTTYRLSTCPNHPEFVGCAGHPQCVIPYLPDFWLPDYGFWVEVKGDLNDDNALLKLLEAAACVSINSGACGTARGEIVVFGPIPSYRDEWEPYRLHFHKGMLYAIPFTDKRCYGSYENTVAGDYGGELADIISGAHSGVLADYILGGDVCARTPPWIKQALTAARSARFEHGQSGI